MTMTTAVPMRDLGGGGEVLCPVPSTGPVPRQGGRGWQHIVSHRRDELPALARRTEQGHRRPQGEGLIRNVRKNGVDPVDDESAESLGGHQDLNTWWSPGPLWSPGPVGRIASKARQGQEVDTRSSSGPWGQRPPLTRMWSVEGMLTV